MLKQLGFTKRAIKNSSKIKGILVDILRWLWLQAYAKRSTSHSRVVAASLQPHPPAYQSQIQTARTAGKNEGKGLRLRSRPFLHASATTKLLLKSWTLKWGLTSRSFRHPCRYAQIMDTRQGSDEESQNACGERTGGGGL
jgi:hypothetical protein